MSGKKLILFLSGIALLAFGGSFAVSFFLMGPEPVPEKVQADPNDKLVDSSPVMANLARLDDLTPKEKDLQMLAAEVREAKDQVRRRREAVEADEERLAMARKEIEDQAKGLEQLRLEVAEAVRKVKKERQLLEQTRLEISQQEQRNIQRTALVYEKTSSTAAADIITNMCTDGQEEYAAKILYTMQPRSAAKVLGKVRDPSLAARLTQLLKRIKSKE